MEKGLIKILDNEAADRLGKCQLSIMSKPYFTIVFCIIFSIVCIISKAFLIFGLIVFVISVFLLIKAPNRKAIEFYNEVMVLYFWENNNLVAKQVCYADIRHWMVKKGNIGGDKLIFELFDNEFINFETFRIVAVIRKLNKIIPEKRVNA